MKKFEAPSLEDAYLEASKFFECSILELQCEVIQNPTKGIFGFGKKNAIIIADIIKTGENNKPKVITPVKSKEEPKKDFVQINRPIKKIEILDDSVSEKFFKDKKEPISYTDKTCSDSITPTYNVPLAKEIEKSLKKLLAKSCFS
ncbi:MAG: Jag N-terminal domain-containing protein, partial [Epsilonproteobacteria bacterium]|nr:Jag N-terminal domain-containing protein [Campylobacterota bacterium]